eukprot:SAG11_NODE_2517_length_3265_cov_1.739419_2_plen_50_part_00
MLRPRAVVLLVLKWIDRDDDDRLGVAAERRGQPEHAFVVKVEIGVGPPA